MSGMTARVATCIATAFGAMLLGIATSSARASCGDDPECDPLTDWTKFTSITLELSQPGAAPLARWHARLDHTLSDTAIDMETRTEKGAPIKGTIAMVGGRVMLTKDLQPDRGREIDWLDGPVLNIILVTKLLGREFPEGPESLNGSRRIDRTDKVGLKYATPSAQGYIPAPWHLVGTITKKAGGSFDAAGLTSCILSS